MVARINPKKIKQKLRKVEYLFLAVVCIVFLLVAGKYYYTHIRITTLKNIWGTINARLQSAGLHCAEKQIRISVTDWLSEDIISRSLDVFEKAGKKFGIL